MGVLDSKVIVLTGGSLGIGREIAKKCASEGATLVIAARGKQNLAESLEELREISDKPHQFYEVDIGRSEEVINFAKFCSKEFGEINGLVNCAGVYGPIGKLTDIDLDEFAAAIQINFLGTVFMCQAFAPTLRSETRKKIVNYSGGGAAGPFPNFSAYATSKIAIVRFTENLSIEFEDDGFDVNCIAPGFVITRLHQETLKAGPLLASDSFYENTKKQIESGGVSPEKAADLTVFLLSEKSDGITGKFISAPWDNWSNEAFQEKLRLEDNFATLRRIDDKMFYEKQE